MYIVLITTTSFGLGKVLQTLQERIAPQQTSIYLWKLKNIHWISSMNLVGKYIILNLFKIQYVCQIYYIKSIEIVLVNSQNKNVT